MPATFPSAPPLLTRRDAVAPRQTAAAVLCSTPQLCPIIPLTPAPHRAWERPRGRHNPKGHWPGTAVTEQGWLTSPGAAGREQGASHAPVSPSHPSLWPRERGVFPSIWAVPSVPGPSEPQHQCTKTKQPPTSKICAQICDAGGADPRCPLLLSKPSHRWQYYPCKQEDVEINFFFLLFFFSFPNICDPGAASSRVPSLLENAGSLEQGKELWEGRVLPPRRGLPARR